MFVLTALNLSHVYSKAIVRFPSCSGKIAFSYLEDDTPPFPEQEQPCLHP